MAQIVENREVNGELTDYKDFVTKPLAIRFDTYENANETGLSVTQTTVSHLMEFTDLDIKFKVPQDFFEGQYKIIKAQLTYSFDDLYHFKTANKDYVMSAVRGHIDEVTSISIPLRKPLNTNDFIPSIFDRGDYKTQNDHSKLKYDLANEMSLDYYKGLDTILCSIKSESKSRDVLKHCGVIRLMGQDLKKTDLIKLRDLLIGSGATDFIEIVNRKIENYWITKLKFYTPFLNKPFETSCEIIKLRFSFNTA